MHCDIFFNNRLLQLSSGGQLREVAVFVLILGLRGLLDQELTGMTRIGGYFRGEVET